MACTDPCCQGGVKHSRVERVEDVWEEEEQRVDTHGAEVLPKEYRGVSNLRAQECSLCVTETALMALLIHPRVLH